MGSDQYQIALAMTEKIISAARAIHTIRTIVVLVFLLFFVRPAIGNPPVMQCIKISIPSFGWENNAAFSLYREGIKVVFVKLLIIDILRR